MVVVVVLLLLLLQLPLRRRRLRLLPPALGGYCFLGRHLAAAGLLSQFVNYHNGPSSCAPYAFPLMLVGPLRTDLMYVGTYVYASTVRVCS